MFDFLVHEYFNTVPQTLRSNKKTLQWLSHSYVACRPKVMFVGPNNSTTKQKEFLCQLQSFKYGELVNSKYNLIIE